MTVHRPRSRSIPALLAAAGLVTAASALVAAPASAATGCAVSWTPNTWNTGFTADVKVTNLGDPVTGWTLTFTFPSGQQLTSGWSATWSQSGNRVTATGLDWNSRLATGASTVVGLQGSHPGTNTAPGDFAVNGVACTGTPAPGPTPSATTPAPSPSPTTPAPSPTPTTPAPTPTTPSVAHVDNPFAGAVGYVNPLIKARVDALAAGTGGSLGAAMSAVGRQPTFVWMDRIAAIAGNGTDANRGLAWHLDQALAQQQASGVQTVVGVVVYDLPNRDCAAAASNGELTVANGGPAAYRTQYVDPLRAVLAQPKYATLRIATVVEPDSLPNLVTNTSIQKCSEAATAYRDGVRYALDQLHSLGNVYTYLDAAHSGWLGWDSNFGPAVQLFKDVVGGTAAGLASVDGFVTNTANYTPLVEPNLPDSGYQIANNPIRSADFYEWNPYFDEAHYATALRTALVAAGFPSTLGMLVDTGRNGWGGPNRPTSASGTTVNAYVDSGRIDRRAHRGSWCNQAAGIGERPTAAPRAGFDAYVWVKPPGESDGTSDTSQTTPDADGKRFDPMCDPNGQSRYNSTYPTGALANMPAAGAWSDAAFALLVRNASPSL